MNRLYYIIALCALLASCSTDDTNHIFGVEGAVEITGINACVDNGANASTRAVAELADNVGRTDFITNDVILFTNIERTSNPIEAFTYPHNGETIDLIRTAQTSWERRSQIPERIYWTDAQNPHTFKGYGCPQGAFDWKKADGSTYFFGSLGDPTEPQTTEGGITTHFIDYSNDADDTPDAETKKYYSGNTKICNDDILLSYNTAQQADPGGQVATIRFYHGLCCVRVVVNISGFAASSTSADSKSLVTNLELLNMRTMYKWDQQSHDCVGLTEGDQTNLNTLYANPGDGKSVPSWNQEKDIHCWTPDPNGLGEGNTKTFTFYGLAVPTTGKTQNVKFSVTYPDPMNPNTNITKPYTATINDVEFRAGHCTTINISLNHNNDKMTVGAEYQDWIFIPSPNQGDLKKNSTFLSYIPTSEADRIAKKIYIADDAQATADDALWLYKVRDAQGNVTKDAQGKDIIKDIYDNDGSAAHPYIISTANQLLAFAYEVKSGRDFVHKFVKLDTDITLQESLTGTGLRWIGIGDATHAFNGFFLGDGRHINRLYGEHFFYKIGDNAVIDKLNFNNVLELDGCGVIAHENWGLICSCFLDGDVTETNTSTQYTGSIVGINNSFIIACSHVGKVTGYGKIGGLVGYNNGTVMASFHSGVVEVKTGGSGEAHPTVGAYGTGSDGKNNSIMFSCYYDSNVFNDDRLLVPGKLGYPLPTSVMQSFAFVRDFDDTDAPSFVFDAEGKYVGATGPKLRQIAENIVRKNHRSEYTDKQIADMSDADLIAIILPADAMSDDVYDMFENHFSLNTALRVFKYWLARIHTEMEGKPDTAYIETNCHRFYKPQIDFLYQHYNTQHVFVYTPATYPKAQ